MDPDGYDDYNIFDEPPRYPEGSKVVIGGEEYDLNAVLESVTDSIRLPDEVPLEDEEYVEPRKLRLPRRRRR